MEDRQALQALVDAKGTDIAAAKFVGVSKQLFYHWKKTGISPAGRPQVWFALRKIGVRLKPDWLKAEKRAA